MAFGTDIPRLQGNHTRYLYGPGDILKAHTADESITVGELESAVEGYKKLIMHEVEAKNAKRC
jgi:acetylornithine deacetylase